VEDIKGASPQPPPKEGVGGRAAHSLSQRKQEERLNFHNFSKTNKLITSFIPKHFCIQNID
jgi:hypothetical protein